MKHCCYFMGHSLIKALPTSVFQNSVFIVSLRFFTPQHKEALEGQVFQHQLEFNSATNHTELAQILQVKGSVLHETILTSDVSYPSWVLRPPPFITNQLYIWGAHDLLKFFNLLEQLTELNKDLKVFALMEIMMKWNLQTNRQLHYSILRALWRKYRLL